MKGDYLQECSRKVCNNKPAQYFNHSTEKYYCKACAVLINDANRKRYRQRMNVHEVKVHSSVWQDLWDGRKPWEFRKNDRGFKVGDGLRLRKIDPRTEKFVEGDLNTIHRRIIYILEGPAFGIPDGYCIMTLK